MVDTSSVAVEVTGLVAVSGVPGSVVGSVVGGNGGLVVTETVEVAVEGVVSLVSVVSAGVR